MLDQDTHMNEMENRISTKWEMDGESYWMEPRTQFKIQDIQINSETEKKMGRRYQRIPQTWRERDRKLYGKKTHIMDQISKRPWKMDSTWERLHNDCRGKIWKQCETKQLPSKPTSKIRQRSETEWGRSSRHNIRQSEGKVQTSKKQTNLKAAAAPCSAHRMSRNGPEHPDVWWSRTSWWVDRKEITCGKDTSAKQLRLDTTQAWPRRSRNSVSPTSSKGRRKLLRSDWWAMVLATLFLLLSSWFSWFPWPPSFSLLHRIWWFNWQRV